MSALSRALNALLEWLYRQLLFASGWMLAIVLLGEFIRWCASREQTAVTLATSAGGAAILWYALRLINVNLPRLDELRVPAYAGGGDGTMQAPDVFDLVQRLDFRLPGVFPAFPAKDHAIRSAGGPGYQPQSRRREWTLRGIEVVAFLILIFAAMCLLAAIGLAIPGLIKRYNFTISVLLVVGVMLYFTLKPGFLSRQNWKKLKEEWLTFPGAPALFIVGFGAAAKIGSPEWVQAVISNGEKFAQVTTALGPIVMLTLLMFFVGYGLMSVGRQNMETELSRTPLEVFLCSLACAWIASAGFYTVTIYGFIVALCAYLPA